MQCSRWFKRFKQFRRGQDSSAVDSRCSKETISFVKRSTIREGTFVVGEKVKVTWWKSKKAYNAKVLSINSVPPAPPRPRGRATAEEEPFAFQFAAAAPHAAAQAKPPSNEDQ